MMPDNGILANIYNLARNGAGLIIWHKEIIPWSAKVYNDLGRMGNSNRLMLPILFYSF